MSISVAPSAPSKGIQQGKAALTESGRGAGTFGTLLDADHGASPAAQTGGETRRPAFGRATEIVLSERAPIDPISQGDPQTSAAVAASDEESGFLIVRSLLARPQAWPTPAPLVAADPESAPRSEFPVFSIDPAFRPNASMRLPTGPSSQEADPDRPNFPEFNPKGSIGDSATAVGSPTRTARGRSPRTRTPIGRNPILGLPCRCPRSSPRSGCRNKGRALVLRPSHQAN